MKKKGKGRRMIVKKKGLREEKGRSGYRKTESRYREIVVVIVVVVVVVALLPKRLPWLFEQEL